MRPCPAKVVVFDFDGVILESADIKTEAFVELFSGRPEHLDAIRRHHLANLGVSRFKKFEFIYRELYREPFDDQVSERLGAAFSNLVLTKVLSAPFVPGAISALDDLLGVVRLYVASGTPETELRHIVERRGLDRYFLAVHGSPKEKTTAIEETLAETGAAKEELVFVGDGESDYRAAESTGVRFIARDTPEVHDEWVKAGVERISDLRELPRALLAR
ncbi:MAG: HAD family hydrolase [Deltaproteobacteria bacterium]|nr:HAD family hydrolase [Deltaproteobacteria bacterium]